MKSFMGYSFIVLLSFVVIIHFVKTLHLIFNIKALDKYKTFSIKPDKFTLFIYYVLVVCVSVFAILNKLESLNR